MSPDQDIGKLRLQFNVPLESVSRILGPKGQTIKRINQTTGAKAEFLLNRGKSAQYRKERTLVIDGTPDQVNHAAELFRDLCDKTPPPRFIRASTHISVPADRVELIIGKSWSNVKKVGSIQKSVIYVFFS